MNREIKPTIDKSQLRDQEHNYEVVETDDGFMVVPIEKDREPVVASVGKNGFWVINGTQSHETTMYDFFNISLEVVQCLYETWKSPVFNPYEYTKESEALHSMSQQAQNDYFIKLGKFYKIRHWAMITTKKTLSRKIRDIWKKKNEEIVPEDIRLLHRRLFSVSSGKGYDELLKIILADKAKYEYLIKDLINYRAARALASDVRAEYLLENGWQNIFGDMTSGSMRKTVMNLPGMPYYYATYFFRTACILPEPALTRMRYMAYAVLAKFRDSKWEAISKVVLRSSDDDIRKAIKMAWEYQMNIPKSGFRSIGYIAEALRFIYDFDDTVGKWDIVGLSKRSIAYHNDVAHNRRDAETERLKQRGIKIEQPTRVPPIAIPETPSIRFLDTYKAILNEGVLMGHCISGYADSAIRGQCFLFHVDYENEMASVEVSPEGYVVQSQGPHNKDNKASLYGKRALGKWAKSMTKNSSEPIYYRGGIVREDDLNHVRLNYDYEGAIPF